MPISSVSLLATGFTAVRFSSIHSEVHRRTSANFTQSLSDWHSRPAIRRDECGFHGLPQTASGTKDNRAFYLYGYSFALDKTKR